MSIISIVVGSITRREVFWAILSTTGCVHHEVQEAEMEGIEQEIELIPQGDKLR